MPVIRQEVLRQCAFEIFRATGIPETDARIVGNHLVDSQLAGHDSHGTWFIPSYVQGMKKNYVCWEERQVVRENPSLAIIDCKGANGIVAVSRALELAAAKARVATFGFVGLHNLSHIGRLGAYPPQLAAQGLLGMVWLNGGGLFMTPFGSADRRLRPEPIAFAAPRRQGAPFMLDMTMTTVAGGKIEQKLIRDQPLPEGWVIDQQGQWVTDGQRYRNAEETGVPPLGGLQFGHKGYGLAMMVEMLVGPLSHAGCTKGDKGGGNGVMVLAIDISAFTSLETYVDEVEGLAEWVCSAKPLPGFNKVYAPGEIEEETRQRRLWEGIDVAERTWAEIGKTAAELGVAIPKV
ncbi:MAG: Ldh family oxidoreductase [Candidatus Handelsmanbacteria bacterium]|nr:Ldh family oxidoreductase [Candidatus Handelsmanbacteria bacterium]